jgi:hypothetical protein
MMCLLLLLTFLSSKWEVKHITIELFEVFDTSGVAMAPRL